MRRLRMTIVQEFGEIGCYDAVIYRGDEQPFLRVGWEVCPNLQCGASEQTGKTFFVHVGYLPVRETSAPLEPVAPA